MYGLRLTQQPAGRKDRIQVGQEQALRTGVHRQPGSQGRGKVRFSLRPVFFRKQGVRQQQGGTAVKFRQGRERVGVPGLSENMALRLDPVSDGRHGMPRLSHAHGAGSDGE